MDLAKSTAEMMALRKLTRVLAKRFEDDLRSHLGVIAPVVRPAAVFGDFVRGGSRDSSLTADRAFTELRTVFERVMKAPPFRLPTDLPSPIEAPDLALEIAPEEYPYTPSGEGEQKPLTITRPLRWVLGYGGGTLAGLHGHLKARTRDPVAVGLGVTHLCMLHVVLGVRPAVTRLLAALRYEVITERLPLFGELPITIISGPVGTARPSDAVLVESTEVSGLAGFQEVVDVDAVRALRDPLGERLREVLREHGFKS